MTTWLDRLTPKNIRNLIPYSSARREAISGEVWLNANENPFTRRSGDFPSALNRYPEFQPTALLEAYSRYAGVSPDQLLVTRGIDEGLDLLIRSFCTGGEDQIVYTPPTYGMYRITAETQGVHCMPTPLLENWKLDLPQVIVEAGDSKLVFLCSPNNPTGNLIKKSKVIKILEATRNQTLVVLDEAYIEFVPEASYVQLLADYPNLVVLRTLSKAFGLAGLRCGFILASPEIISVIKKVTPPYPIPVPVADLAVAALSEAGIQRMRLEVDLISSSREDLMEKLKNFSFIRKIYPGVANFILLKVKDAADLMNSLETKGIVIRNQSKQILLENCVRISIGTPEETSLLLAAFKDYEVQQ
jgi:histidinol-phosphate aminotransferase